MPITARLSRKLRQTLGDEAAEDMVNWMQQVDGHSGELGELREAIRADLAELRQEMHAGFAQVDVKHAGLRQEMLTGFADLRQEIARLETKIEKRTADLIKWSFVFWVGAVGAIAMLARVLR
jgi:hypothetical protein